MCLATWIQTPSFAHDVSCYMETKSFLCPRCVFLHRYKSLPMCSMFTTLRQNPPYVHDVLPHGYEFLPVCTSCHMDTKSFLCARCFRHMYTISSVSPRCLATWIQSPPSVHVLPQGCLKNPPCVHVLPQGCIQNPPCVHVLPQGCIQNPPCVHVLPQGYKKKSSLCARCLATGKLHLHSSIHGESVDGWMGDCYVHGFARKDTAHPEIYSE